MANSFWTSANVEPKRKYRFLVQITGTKEVGALWFAKGVNKPEITVESTEHTYLNHKFYYPGMVSWNEVSVTLVDPVSPDAAQITAEMLESSGYAGPSQLKGEAPHMQVIAGNVATGRGAIDLAQAGADAIKVGVGPGGVCTTRLVAGVGVPQLTAVSQAVEANCGVPIIADGGIRTSGDIAKALAVGADSVMIGSMFAGTKEAPGEVEQTDRGLFKRIRGMASREAAEHRAARAGEELDDEYFEHRAAEGVEGLVPYRGSVELLVNELMAGLKSSMSYSNSATLAEFRARAQMVRITGAGLNENHPHATA